MEEAEECLPPALDPAMGGQLLNPRKSKAQAYKDKEKLQQEELNTCRELIEGIEYAFLSGHLGRDGDGAMTSSAMPLVKRHTLLSGDQPATAAEPSAFLANRLYAALLEAQPLQCISDAYLLYRAVSSVSSNIAASRGAGTSSSTDTGAHVDTASKGSSRKKMRVSASEEKKKKETEREAPLSPGLFQKVEKFLTGGEAISGLSHLRPKADAKRCIDKFFEACPVNGERSRSAGVCGSTLLWSMRSPSLPSLKSQSHSKKPTAVELFILPPASEIQKLIVRLVRSRSEKDVGIAIEILHAVSTAMVVGSSNRAAHEEPLQSNIPIIMDSLPVQRRYGADAQWSYAPSFLEFVAILDRTVFYFEHYQQEISDASGSKKNNSDNDIGTIAKQVLHGPVVALEFMAITLARKRFSFKMPAGRKKQNQKNQCPIDCLPVVRDVLQAENVPYLRALRLLLFQAIRMWRVAQSFSHSKSFSVNRKKKSNSSSYSNTEKPGINTTTCATSALHLIAQRCLGAVLLLCVAIDEVWSRRWSHQLVRKPLFVSSVSLNASVNKDDANLIAARDTEYNELLSHLVGMTAADVLGLVQSEHLIPCDKAGFQRKQRSHDGSGSDSGKGTGSAFRGHGVTSFPFISTLKRCVLLLSEEESRRFKGVSKGVSGKKSHTTLEELTLSQEQIDDLINQLCLETDRRAADMRVCLEDDLLAVQPPAGLIDTMLNARKGTAVFASNSFERELSQLISECCSL